MYGSRVSLRLRTQRHTGDNIQSVDNIAEDQEVE